ncbi:excinuclease ABC subunit UvrC [Magnetococcus sp. PR-3]|uniref:excinuclease ABC subunit UvrC n=1 Tax=Magnetococcus sp. PR-3 TaxID=3120355 RepID=UPI002FCDE759
MAEKACEEERLDRLKRVVKQLPLKPGVYRFYDGEDQLLYVGKAKALRKRVSSYFSRQSGHSPKTIVMVKQIQRLEFTVTATENDALVLEANLIKAHQPRYNVVFKDNKSYPYLHLSTQHDYPALALYRGDRKIPGRFFGPYPSTHAVRDTLKWLQKIFPVRQCEDSQFNHRTRPCLQYQIHRCGGPCCDRISLANYGKMVDQVSLFLEGKDKQLVKALKEDMWQAAQDRDFEGAARLRDRINGIEHVQERRRLNLTGEVDLDVMSVSVGVKKAIVQVFFIRAGINLGNRAFFLDKGEEEDPTIILQAFVSQFYLDKPPPPEILLEYLPLEQEMLEEALSERLGKRVKLLHPQRGERRRLLEMAQENAQQALKQYQSSRDHVRDQLEGLQEIFNLSEPPQRIEIYDNSHMQDSNAVGAMVVFGPEGFEKNQYRKFNLEESGAPDDTARMIAVLTRRFKRLKEGEGRWPDIVLLDGGIAQLNAALKVVEDLQIDGVLFTAIAKGPERNAGQERLFLPAQSNPLILPEDSPLLHFLQVVRDEAHRFVIGFHRNRRGKRQTRSLLDGIAGVGPSRKKVLIKQFGSVKGVREASQEEIAALPGFSTHLARTIMDALDETSG